MRWLDGTPSEAFAHPELLDLFIPMLRADLELIESHVSRPGRLLTCPVTAFAGASDPAAPAAFAPGWGDHASGPFVSRIFEGGHLFLRTAEAEVPESIRAVLPRRAGRISCGQGSTSAGSRSRRRGEAAAASTGR